MFLGRKITHPPRGWAFRAEHHPPSERVGFEGALAEERAEEVLQRLLAQLPQLGVEVLASTTSPIRRAKSGRKKRGQGNVEYLVWARKIITRKLRDTL